MHAGAPECNMVRSTQTYISTPFYVRPGESFDTTLQLLSPVKELIVGCLFLLMKIIGTTPLLTHVTNSFLFINFLRSNTRLCIYAHI